MWSYTKITIIHFIVHILTKDATCANILYIAPVASPSHHIWNKALAFGLIGKGHNVTMLGHDAEKEPLPNNFTLIVMEGFYEDEDAALDIDMLLEQTPLSGIDEMYTWASYCCQYDLSTTGLENLLNYPKQYHFDLIIYDVSLGQCLYPLIQIFHNPPVLAVTPFLLPPVLSSSFGNHMYTSYMPFYNTNFLNQMSFFQRLLNFIYIYWEQIYRNYIFLPRETTTAYTKFGRNIPALEEIERNMTILLSNIDAVFDYPLALPPNIIPVGGLHLKPAQALPTDLQRILDGAREGVVLFSLGTNVRSDKLNMNRRNALLEAFSKIPQVVLWKFEKENLEGLPNNVVIRKWLPQNDILGHPNTKLFISHGGALSTQEAIYHGVPILGIPIFSDQVSNIAKMVDKKLAKFVDIRSLTSTIMYETITDMLNSPVYYDNAKRASKLFRDQTQTPLERAMFWAEYLMRHGNAQHLLTAARDMSFVQTFNIDIAVVLVFALITISAFGMLTLIGFRFLFTMRRQSTKIKKSK